VVPVLGPKTLRDGFGGAVDMFFQPLTYLVGPVQNIVLGISSGFTTLDARDAALKALEDSSVDFYAALRSAYLQSRAAHIRADDSREFIGDESQFIGDESRFIGDESQVSGEESQLSGDER
jgi:phospholipid-binding lipoprotein MlaA